MSTTWTVKKLNVFLPSSSQGLSECRPKTQNFKKKDNKGQKKTSKWLSLFHYTYISNPHIWPPYFGRFFPHKMESVKPVKKPPKIEVGWPTQNSPAFRFILSLRMDDQSTSSTNPGSDDPRNGSMRVMYWLCRMDLCQVGEVVEPCCGVFLLRYIICVCISYIFWVGIHCIYIYNMYLIIYYLHLYTK